MGDAFGRAVLDTLRGERRGAVEYRRDGETEDALVERYFASPESWPDREHTLLAGLTGRVLDLGCGAGRHAIHLQDRHAVAEVVAVDVSPRSVIATWERGVERSVVSNMSCLPFTAGAFDHVVCLGTQICTGTGLDDVAANLQEAARVTDTGGPLVADCFDPRDSDDWDWFGYDDHPEPGVGRRSFDVVYDGDQTRIELTLVSPDRFRNLAAAAGWSVDVVDRDGAIYSVRCTRRNTRPRNDESPRRVSTPDEGANRPVPFITGKSPFCCSQFRHRSTDCEMERTPGLATVPCRCR